jgi:ABC-type transport system involved in Fe-S cluster assembly fused permease/ATPase subunit
LFLFLQDCVLFHDTVFHNIHYGNLSKTEQDVYHAAKMAEIHDTITNRFPEKYKTQVGERGLKLSGDFISTINIHVSLLSHMEKLFTKVQQFLWLRQGSNH